MSRIAITLALALSTLTTAAVAQDKQAGEGREKFRAACAADIQKFCSNVGTEKGASRACLDSNAAQLSDPCKAVRAERAAARAKEKS